MLPFGARRPARTTRALPAVAAVVVTVVAALVVGLLGALAGSASAAPSDTYEHDAFRSTNVQRARHDLRTLDHDACLQRFAERNARRIARIGRLEHQDLGRIQRRCDVGYVGENIAYGYASGRDVVRGWMHSEGHRANILSPHYRTLGLDAVHARGSWWAVQVFADH